MIFFSKPLTDIRQGDLEAVVQQNVRERQTLEFKRDSYPRNPQGTREMLRDVTAMANAFGGEIVLGVATEGDGVASAIVGIPDGEREAQRITDSCISNVEERIAGLMAWPVPLTDGKHVIVIRIPQSSRAPHMVSFEGKNEFWVRHDRRKGRMSVHEVRETCLRVEMLSSRLTQFLERRLAEVPTFAGGRPTITLSLTPLLVSREPVQTRDQKLRLILQTSSLNRGDVPSPCITGLELKGLPHWRLRLDRNGHLDYWSDFTEFIAESRHLDQKVKTLNGLTVNEFVHRLYTLGKSVYEHCGIAEILIAKFDLWNIKNMHLGRWDHLFGALEPSQEAWHNDRLDLDGIEVDSSLLPDRAAKILLDRVWETFGYEESFFGKSPSNP